MSQKIRDPTILSKCIYILNWISIIYKIDERFSVLSPKQSFNLWYEKLDHKKVFQSKFQTEGLKRRPGGMGAKTISPSNEEIWPMS